MALWTPMLAGISGAAQGAGAPVAPTTYYVDQAIGNNAFPGTEAQPWLTLAYGVTSLASGDSLLVKNGTYSASWANGNPQPGYSWTYPTIIRAAPGHSPVITATAGQHAVQFAGTQYVVFRGFEVDATGGLNAVTITTSGSTYPAHHIRIQECDLHSWGNQGIGGDGTVEAIGCEILNNRIHDGGTEVNLDHGLYFAAPEWLVEGNEIYNCFAFGIHIYSSSGIGFAWDCIVRRNFVHDNAVGGAGDGILLGNGGRHVCYSNIVAGNEGGIRSKYAHAGSKIYANTIYDNNVSGPNPGVEVDSVAGCEIKSNIIWSHATPITVTGTTVDQANNLTTDPGFLVASPVYAGNYRCGIGSPALGVGSALPEVLMDYQGLPFPEYEPHDIGAHKWAWTVSGSGANIRFGNGEFVVEMGRAVSHYWWHPVPAVAEIWVQFSINIPTIVQHTEETVFLIPHATDVTVYVMRVRVRQDTGNNIALYMQTRNDALATFTDFVTLGPAPQTYLVDLHWRRASAAGANDGLCEMYINGAGTVAADITGLDNDQATVWSRLVLGAAAAGPAHTIYDATLTGLQAGTTRGGAEIWADDFGGAAALPPVPGAMPTHFGVTGAGTVTTSSTLQTTHTVNVPAHTAGDLLILAVTMRNSALPRGTLVSLSAGWTRIGNASYPGTDQTQQVAAAWKIGAGGNGVNTGEFSMQATCAGSSSADGVKLWVHRFTAADGFAATPISTTVVSMSGGTSASIAMPTIAATGLRELAVCIMGVNFNQGTIAAATGESGGDWTEPVEQDISGTTHVLGIQTAGLAGGGTISGGTAALAPSASYAGMGFSIIPALV